MVEVNTPSGKHFFTLTDTDFAKYFRPSWQQYSDCDLIRMYHSFSEVYSAVNHIAIRVSFGKYQVKRIKTGEVVENDSWLNAILSKPNLYQNWQQFITEAIAYKLVTGKTFTYGNVPDTLKWSYKNINSLINLPSDIVTIQLNANVKLLTATAIEDIVRYYAVANGTNSTINITPDRVMYNHVPSLDAADMKIIGKSPLVSDGRALDNLRAVYEARNVIYTKRGALGLLVSKKGDDSGLQPLTAREKQSAIDDLQSAYGVGGGKSPIGITDVPLDYIRIAMSIDELLPFEELDAVTQAIYSSLRIPREIMPRKEGAKYENQNQAEVALYENVVIPEAKSWCASLNSFLKLADYGLILDVDFNHINVLQENKKEKAEVDWRNNETCRVQFIHGVITLNDWRIKLGYQAVQNALYDKLILEMSPEELTQVTEMLKLKANDATTPQQNVSTGQPQNTNQ